jgi:Holliday junction resolvase RusA-like endonuclease
MRNGHSYTPQRTVQGEINAQFAFRQQVPGYGPARPGDFRLSCIFYIKRDDSDIDNLLKLVMDGLQGVVWVNDKRVRQLGHCEIVVDKLNPRTEVTIEEINVRS